MFKKYKFLLLLAVLMAPWGARAQDLSDYSFTTGTDTTKWVDMSAATQILVPSSSDGLASSLQSIGFNFPFGESTYTQYSVNTDGNLRLGSTVTGTGSYSTPFSSTAAGTNSPKINPFGCDGYGNSGSHYVKSLLVDDTIRVVEFCMGTFTSTTRNELYKWQIHLYASGNIEMVFPGASGMPNTNPDVSYQCGLCVNAGDGLIVDAVAHTVTHFTNGSSATNSSGTWYDAGRYYSFERPVITCPKPISVSAQTTSDEMELTWTPAGEESEWMIVVNNEDVYYSTSTTYTVTDLTPSTLYSVGVHAICGAGDTSLPRTGSFYTACVEVAASELPYTYGFEDASTTGATGTISTCWTKGTNYSTAYPYPSTTAHSGTKSLYFYSYSGSGYYSYAALPLFETPLDSLMLTFWMRQGSTGSSYEGTLRVGVMTDPTDISTFTPLAVCAADGATWTYQEVVLAGYTGTGRYIAFLDNCVASSYSYVYLDDVTVKLAPNCGRVQNLAASHVTTGNALIEWEAGLLGDYNGGVLSYKTATETDWTNVTLTQDDFSYLLTSLTPGSDYTVRFMTNCAAGDTSEYSIAEFSTEALQCEGLALIGTETPTLTSYNVPINNFYNNTVNENLILASELNAQADTIHSIQFYYAYSSPMTSKANCIMYMGDTSLTTLGGFIDTASLTRVYAGSMNCVEGWNTFTLQNPYYYNGGNLVVLIIDNSGDYDGSSYVWGVHNAPGMCYNVYSDGSSYPNVGSMTTFSSSYRPNMKLQIGACENAQTCIAPDVWVSLRKSDTIGLSWIPGYGETSWNVRYKLANAATWNYMGTATEANFVFDNLTPATTYDFAVVSVCDNGDSAVTEITVTTPCVAIAAPLSEGFAVWATNSSAGTPTPACWVRGTTYNTTYVYPYVTTSYSSDGDGKSMYMYNGGSHTWFAMPMLTDSIHNLLMTFDMYSSYVSSGASYSVHVGVMTDPDDATTFHEVGAYLPASNSQWQEMEVDFSNYSGPEGQVAVMAYGSYCYAYIDNIYIERAPTCRKPADLTASANADGDSIVITWTGPANSETWEVEYGLSGFVPGSGNITSTTEPRFAFSDFCHGSNYDVYVRAWCDSEDSSLYRRLAFSTPCAIFERTCMPYFQNFENMPTGTNNPLAACWTKLSNYSSGYPYITNSSSYAHSGTQSLYFYSSGSTHTVAVLPEFEVSVDSLAVSFWLYRSSTTSTYGEIKVGVMTDPGNYNTFVPLAIVQPSGMGIMQYDVMLNNYVDTTNSTHHYIALATQNSGYNTAYVDDIEVYVLSDCRRPASAYTTNVTYNQLDVVFTPDEACSATDYEIRWGMSDNVNAATDSLITSSTTNTITGLNPETSYYFYIRALCGEENSRWLALPVVRTTAACGTVENVNFDYNPANGDIVVSWTPSTVGVPVQYIIEYQSGNESAVVDSTSNTYYHVPNTTPLTTYNFRIRTACDSAYSAQLPLSYATASCNVIGSGGASNDYIPTEYYYSYSYTQSIYTAAELMMLGDTITGMSYYSLGTPGATRTISIYMGNTDVNAFASTGSYVPADSLTQVYTGMMTITTGANHLTFTTPFVRDNSRNLVIAFNDNTGDYVSSTGWEVTPVDATRSLYFYHDDSPILPTAPSAGMYGTLNYVPKIQLDATCMPPSCVAPIVVCSGQTTSSLSLTWFPGLYETSWNVDYRRQGDTAWTSAAAATTQTNITIPNLFASTPYEVRVVSLCGANTATAVINCATECGLAPIPFVENFDSWINSDFTPSCWHVGGTTAPYVSNVINYGPMLRLYTDSYVMLPELAAPVNTLQARFDYVAGDTTAWMLVGVVSDINAIGSMTIIDTLYSTGIGDRTYTVRFNTYSDSVGNIAFYTPHGINYTFIDNLIVEPIRSCAEAINVTASNIDTGSATISWMPYGNTATSYILEYGPTGFALGTGTQIATTGTSYTINALTPSTIYQAYVYTVCAATGDTSYASMYASFTTECAPMYSFPYLMDFDYAGLPATTYHYEMPTCWAYEMTGSGSYATGSYRPSIYYTTSSSYVTSGTHCLYMYGNCVIAMPESAVPLDTLRLRFHEYNSSPSYYGLIIGAVDSITPGFAASFTPIDTIEYVNGVYSYNHELFLPYSGNGRHLAFKNYYITSSSTEFSYHYIDDIQLEFVPACVEPQNISGAGTENSISLNWADITAASQWEIEYGAHGFAQGSGTSTIVSSHPATITGLTYSTEYDVYVRAFCNNGDTSDWKKATVRTTGIMHTLPVDLNFEDSTVYNNIDLLNGTMTNRWTIGSAQNCDTANAPGHALYVSADNGTTAGYNGTSSTLIFATIDVNLDSGWTYYNYDWKCNGESSYDFVRVALIPGGEQLAGSSSYSTVTYGSLPNGWIALDGGDRLNQSYTNWNHVSDSIRLSMPGGYHFAFIWRNDGSVANVPGGIVDNISIWNNGSRCLTPVIATETHDYSQSTISWAGTTESYEIAFKAASDAIWPAETTVSSTSQTYTGLQPNTEYQFRVRAICDAAAGMISDWVLYTFTTDDLPCFAPTALACGETSLSSATLSWTAGTNETEWNVHVWNSGFDSVYHANNSTFTVTGLTQTTTYNVAVSALCGGGLLESEYSDTINVTTQTCPTPGTPTPSSVTGNSAVISWTGSAANYVIEYGMGAFGEGQGTTVEVSGTSYTITGLEPETQYSALVRAKCDNVNLSGWSTRAVFTTEPEDIGIDAVNGMNVNIYPNPTSGNTTITLSGVNGEVSIVIVDLNGRTVRNERATCEGDCAHQLEVSDLASGAYFVRISGEGINTVKKLIVK